MLICRFYFNMLYFKIHLITAHVWIIDLNSIWTWHFILQSTPTKNSHKLNFLQNCLKVFAQSLAQTETLEPHTHVQTYAALSPCWFRTCLALHLLISEVKLSHKPKYNNKNKRTKMVDLTLIIFAIIPVALFGLKY